LRGNTTSNLMSRLPLVPGYLLMGIPSPLQAADIAGRQGGQQHMSGARTSCAPAHAYGWCCCTPLSCSWPEPDAVMQAQVAWAFARQKAPHACPAQP
jgi:hypothetical protein